MFFSRHIEIPANTPKTDPLVARMGVTYGTITHVWIDWWWGVGNLGGARMKHESFQHWPLTGSEWFPSNERGIDFDEDYEILTEPTIITIEAYNVDDTFPHSVWVAMEVERMPGLELRRTSILNLRGW